MDRLTDAQLSQTNNSEFDLYYTYILYVLYIYICNINVGPHNYRDRSLWVRCGTTSEKDESCEIARAEIEPLMFCTRWHGRNIQLNLIRYFLVCLFCVSVCACVCVSVFRLQVWACRCEYTVWLKPLFHKRHLLIISHDNVPCRRLQKALIKKLLLSARGAAAQVDAQRLGHCGHAAPLRTDAFHLLHTGSWDTLCQRRFPVLHPSPLYLMVSRASTVGRKQGINPG